MTTFYSRLIVLAALCVTAAVAAPTDPIPPDVSSGARYTFSWPLHGANPAPRGGTTRGPAVTLDTRESSPWRALQAPRLTSFERDRRAILAMAGEYRVTFDFLEIASFRPDGRRDPPYQTWGTERIYVDQDRGAFISLVHILEMRVIEKDGSVSAPIGEYGVAHYERLRDADFTAATWYFERTQSFWDQVHAAWTDVFRDNAPVTLHAPGDRSNRHEQDLSDYADELAAGHTPKENAAALIRAALSEVGAPMPAELPDQPRQ